MVSSSKPTVMDDGGGDANPTRPLLFLFPSTRLPFWSAGTHGCLPRGRSRCLALPRCWPGPREMMHKSNARLRPYSSWNERT